MVGDPEHEKATKGLGDTSITPKTRKLEENRTRDLSLSIRSERPGDHVNINWYPEFV